MEESIKSARVKMVKVVENDKAKEAVKRGVVTVKTTRALSIYWL